MTSLNWQETLPSHLILSGSIASKLEEFRESIGCPEEVFGMRIIGSAWATRRTQKETYDKARREHPSASELELVRIVYEVRKLTSEAAGQPLPSLPSSCRTLDSLVNFIISDESKYALPDFLGWGAKIDSILASAP